MDISKAFVVANATYYSYAQFLIRIVPNNSIQMCQMSCYFETDCHFLVMFNSTTCGVGNFKLTPPTSLIFKEPVVVFIYKGKYYKLF
jgi:hypothetical protein